MNSNKKFNVKKENNFPFESGEFKINSASLKIVIIASYAPSILNFRKELIAAFLQYAEVTVLAPWEDKETESAIVALGVAYRPIFLSSRGVNPWEDLKTMRELVNLLKEISPEFVYSYTIKPVIWGSIAAKKAGVKNIYGMIEGLGYAFTEVRSLKHKIIQKIVVFLYRRALILNKTTFFLNPDDRKLFNNLKITSKNKNQVTLNGCGVDLNYYHYSIPEGNSIKFLLIARLLKDKGLIEYINAAKIIKENYPFAEFHLVGYIDNNPAAVSQAQLNAWIEQEIIVFHGKLSDVRPVIRASSVYVLPSYREGTPRSTLEAMSMGRAVITTDAPGCRETVIDGYNGFLVPVKNVDGLVLAMLKFIENPELVKTMGAASRELAEKRYDVHQVNRVILEAMELV